MCVRIDSPSEPPVRADRLDKLTLDEIKYILQRTPWGLQASSPDFPVFLLASHTRILRADNGIRNIFRSCT